jgi:hypothetical protein
MALRDPCEVLQTEQSEASLPEQPVVWPRQSQCVMSMLIIWEELQNGNWAALEYKNGLSR